MITKREVLNSISRCEPLATTPLDRTQVLVERGDLAVLVEAAKMARYTEMVPPYEPKSETEWILVGSRE